MVEWLSDEEGNGLLAPFTGAAYPCHPERSEGPLVLCVTGAGFDGMRRGEGAITRRDDAVRQYYVYILANRSHTLYTGVTNDLLHRVRQHRSKLIEGFTKKYNITRLVHYETFSDITQAIAREKQIKGWTRDKKVALIQSVNRYWRDLAAAWLTESTTPTFSSGDSPRND